VSDLLELLGKRIHDLRAARKWSQEEFAHVSGLHRTYIGQIERGEKNMSFDNLAKVAGSLGVTLSALLDGLENGTATNLKSLQGELGGKGAADATHRLLAAEKLVRRLKIQHAEMSRTILALEDLPAKSRRRSESPGRQAQKHSGTTRR
jgi:transcriptional regulator with XRE-family HTH domain